MGDIKQELVQAVATLKRPEADERRKFSGRGTPEEWKAFRDRVELIKYDSKHTESVVNCMLEEQRYHASSDPSYSHLKLLAESPRKYEARYITKTDAFEPTPSMEFGSALHLVLLEPRRLSFEVLEIPAEVLSKSGSRSGKAWDEYAAANEGKILLKSREYQLMLELRKRVLEHPVAGVLMGPRGVVEKPLSWVDGETGVRMRAKPDKVHPDAHMIVDVKTCSDASPEAFKQSIAKYYYHLQAAVYTDACIVNYGLANWQFFFVVIETEAPYRVRVYTLDAEAKQIGSQVYRRLIADYADRVERGDWSDPNENECIDLSLPNWAVNKEVFA